MSPTQLTLSHRAVTYVTARCHVSVSALDSSSRAANVVFARQILAWLLRYRAGLSFPQIGLLMNRCHTSIFHSLRSLNNRVETNCATARQVATLIHEFPPTPNHASRITHHAS